MPSADGARPASWRRLAITRAREAGCRLEAFRNCTRTQHRQSILHPVSGVGVLLMLTAFCKYSGCSWCSGSVKGVLGASLDVLAFWVRSDLNPLLGPPDAAWPGARAGLRRGALPRAALRAPPLLAAARGAAPPPSSACDARPTPSAPGEDGRKQGQAALSRCRSNLSYRAVY